MENWSVAKGDWEETAKERLKMNSFLSISHNRSPALPKKVGRKSGFGKRGDFAVILQASWISAFQKVRFPYVTRSRIYWGKKKIDRDETCEERLQTGKPFSTWISDIFRELRVPHFSPHSDHVSIVSFRHLWAILPIDNQRFVWNSSGIVNDCSIFPRRKKIRKSLFTKLEEREPKQSHQSGESENYEFP